MENKTIPIRLSHSSLSTLHTCERKFQIEKFLTEEKEDSEHLSFGSAYGVGVATYLSTSDPDQALYRAWLAYWPEVESSKKSITLCLALLQSSFPKLDDLLQDYEIVMYQGKPAAELSFRMAINEKFYFVGHIDIILRHKFTGRYTVLEVKHTGLNAFDLSPLYANSGQALGYSIALDSVTGQEQDSYEVLYFVGQLGKTPYESNPHTLVFQKTLLDRLNWFLTLGLDVKRIEEMMELGVWPRRGDSCMKFNRPCYHFQTCSLSAFESTVTPKIDDKVYDFNFDMHELIANHIQRVQQTSNQGLLA